MTTSNHIAPIARVLRTYSYGYTANHDFSAAVPIMAEDYELRMGTFRLQGRDTAYRSAAERQLEQYPGMGFTVLNVVSNGERAAMHFCEHGVNSRAGTGAAWTGISLYEWDGTRLTSCRVEQDYLSRARQLEAGVGDAVPTPALDPWIHAEAAEDGATVERVRAWLATDWLRDTTVTFDDEGRSEARRVAMSESQTQVLDMFGAGDTVAFHAEVTGRVESAPSVPEAQLPAPGARLFASGIVHVRDDGSVGGHVITDRFALARRIADAVDEG